MRGVRGTKESEGSMLAERLGRWLGLWNSVVGRALALRAEVASSSRGEELQKLAPGGGGEGFEGWKGWKSKGRATRAGLLTRLLG